VDDKPQGVPGEIKEFGEEVIILSFAHNAASVLVANAVTLAGNHGKGTQVLAKTLWGMNGLIPIREPCKH